MSGAVATWLGLSLCVAAASPPRPTRGTALPRRLGHAYDRSRAGRRLARRLAAADVGMTPSTWRLAQLMALPPVVLAVSLLGLPLTPALATGGTVVRIAGSLILRMRSGRRCDRIEASLPGVARALAAELARGITVADALTDAAAATAPGRSPGRSMIARAAAAAAVSGDPVRALEECAAEEEPRAAHALRQLACSLALVQRGGGPVGLRRLADALEQRRRLHQQSSAGYAEARLTALMVPLLAATVIAMLLSTQPGAAAAALSPLGMAILGACAGVCAAGAGLVRRLTAA